MSTETTEVAPASDTKDDQIQAVEGKSGEPEQKTAVAQPDAKTDSDVPADGAEDGDDKSADPVSKANKAMQRRIERQNGKIGGLAREREILYEENERLKAMLAGRDAEQEEGEPRQKAKPQDIETLVEQRAAEKLLGDSLNAKADSLLKAGKKEAGFDVALQNLRSEIPFADRSGKPTAFLEALLDTDHAVALVMYLDSEPDEAAELANLNPVQLGRRLGRLEAKLQEGKVKTSKAPAPIDPIGTHGTKQSVNLSSASMAEYEAQRAKQGARWARR